MQAPLNVLGPDCIATEFLGAVAIVLWRHVKRPLDPVPRGHTSIKPLAIKPMEVSFIWSSWCCSAIGGPTCSSEWGFLDKVSLLSQTLSPAHRSRNLQKVAPSVAQKRLF